MAYDSRVVWAEGMFLRPQHFQQFTRYTEGLIERRCSGLVAHGYGLQELVLDRQALSLGKFSLLRARGLLVDGTPFDIPDRDEPPPALDIPADARDAEVRLALPLRRPGAAEVDVLEEPGSLARYTVYEQDLRDVNTGLASGAELTAGVQLGRLRLRLLLATQERGAYSSVGLARIADTRTDGAVILDESYIPPMLDSQADPVLAGFIEEIHGLLRHRGEAVAARVSASGRGGAAEIADFLLLQLVNRSEPVFAQLARDSGLHPQALHRELIALAGELATFTRPDKRPAGFPPYRHEDLKDSFAALMSELRQSLSMVLEQTAIALPLQERKFGVRVSPIADRKLLDGADFVLAVAARVPTEEVRTRFPTQVKIGPVEQIRDLVNLQLPGIRLRPLPVAPRQIPYHAGYVYFELDRSSEYWSALRQSGGFALHVSGEFPGLELEFWAIRS